MLFCTLKTIVVYLFYSCVVKVCMWALNISFKIPLSNFAINVNIESFRQDIVISFYK